MTDTIKSILNEYVYGIKKILRNKLEKVILYGSYAHGDYNNSSDIDIMVIVKAAEQDIPIIREQLSGLAFDISLENDVIISTVIKTNEHFNSWSKTLPLYQNIRKDGILLN